jgi:hypothetical protein
MKKVKLRSNEGMEVLATDHDRITRAVSHVKPCREDCGSPYLASGSGVRRLMELVGRQDHLKRMGLRGRCPGGMHYRSHVALCQGVNRPRKRLKVN